MTMSDWTTVSSTNVQSFRYDPDTEELQVRFVGIKDFLGNDDANDSIRLACEHVLAKLKEEVGRKIIPYTEDRDAWYARIWGNGLPLVENGEPRYAVFVGRTVPKWDNTYANEADAKSRVHRLRNGRP